MTQNATGGISQKSVTYQAPKSKTLITTFLHYFYCIGNKETENRESLYVSKSLLRGPQEVCEVFSSDPRIPINILRFVKH